MALTVTRVTRTQFAGSDDPATGIVTAPSRGGVVEMGWHDLPRSTPGDEAALLIYREVTHLGIGGVRRREREDYVYDQVVLDDRVAPTSSRKRIWARTWLPGVSHSRDALFLVEEVLSESVAPAETWTGRPEERVTRRWAWVVYDLAREYFPVDAEYRASLEAQGMEARVASTRRLHHTARVWAPAEADAAIVEGADAAQEAVWQLVETTRVWVTEDALRWYVWRAVHDHLTGQDRIEGPETMMRGDPGTTLPLTMEAPRIRASQAGSDGILVELWGGWAVYASAVTRREERLAPDGYLVYRRPSRRSRGEYVEQALGIGGAGNAGRKALDLVEETGLHGHAAPPPVSRMDLLDGFDDMPTLEPAEYWQMVADIRAGVDTGATPRGAVIDRETAPGVDYSYYAVAYRGDLTSPQSEIAEATNPSAPNAQGLVTAATRQRKRQVEHAPIVVEALLPPEAYLADLGAGYAGAGAAMPPMDGADAVYGETATFRVPAAVTDLRAPGRGWGPSGSEDGAPVTEPRDMDIDPGVAPWTPSHNADLTTAEEVGAAVATAQWLRWRRRLRTTLELAAPIWHVERGMRLMLEPVQLTHIADDRRRISETSSGAWVVDGFELSRDRDGFRMRLDLEEP